MILGGRGMGERRVTWPIGNALPGDVFAICRSIRSRASAPPRMTLSTSSERAMIRSSTTTPAWGLPPRGRKVTNLMGIGRRLRGFLDLTALDAGSAYANALARALHD